MDKNILVMVNVRKENKMNREKLKFIDLFAGIGDFRLGFEHKIAWNKVCGDNN